MGSTSPTQRNFYETAYHFDNDVRIAMEPRIRRALDLLAPHTGTHFLDVGSGVGWAAHFMTEDGARLAVGFDFARKALVLGRENIPGVERVQADGGMLPFRDNAFDRALSFGSLEHFPDVDKGLREIARVLRADGIAVVVVPNFFSRTEQPQELRLSYSGWRKRFEAAGLRITATRADPGPPVLKDRRPVRMAIRVVTNALAYVPYLPYQFIFKLEHAR